MNQAYKIKAENNKKKLSEEIYRFLQIADYLHFYLSP